MPFNLLSPKKRRAPKESLADHQLQRERSFTPPPSVFREPRTPSQRSVTSPPDDTNSQSSTPRSRVAERIKTTPSSFIRSLRIFSNSNDSDLNLAQTMDSVIEQLRRAKETLPRELSPLVHLLLAHKMKTYALGSLAVPTSWNNGDFEWMECDAKLTGIELAIWPKSAQYGDEDIKPTYLTLLDSKVELLGNNRIKVLQNGQHDHAFLLKFDSKEEYIRWTAALQLAHFEFIAFNEAFTAVMLSLRGMLLSDIHLLLSPKKHFPYSEWCEIRLPQVSPKWLKVYVTVIPSQSKKTGRIEVYTSERATKKNLLLYIPEAHSVFNMYPENFEMIDLNGIIRVAGTIYVNKQLGAMLDGNSISRSGSNSFLRMRGNSLSSVSLRQPETRIPSSGSTSSSSFFQTGSSPQQSAVDSPKSSIKSYVSKHLDEFVLAEHMYLMPVPHPGVCAIETMIRNLIPIIDAFKLYGRPKHLVSDKRDQASYLFGLPSLPHCDYLATSDVIEVVNKCHATAEMENWSEQEWKKELKKVLTNLFAKSNYRGKGDIRTLFNGLDSVFGQMASPMMTLNDRAGSESPVDVPRSADLLDLHNSSSSLSQEYHLEDDGLGEPIRLAEQTLVYESQPKIVNVEEMSQSRPEFQHIFSTLVNLDIKDTRL